MNIRMLAASAFALAILAPAADAATLLRHKHHAEPLQREHVHRSNRWFDLNFQPETCVTVNGFEVTHRWPFDCPTTDMPYYDAYAPDGFAADNYGSTWEGHRHLRFSR